MAKETAEDEAVNKLVEKAAVETAARTAQGSVSPQVEMREGQQQFAATSGSATKRGEEPVTTEAAVVSPAAGVGAGDRLVDATADRSKKTKKASPAKAAKVGPLLVEGCYSSGMWCSVVLHAILLMAKTQVMRHLLAKWCVWLSTVKWDSM